MAYVFDDILADIKDTVETTVAAAGYTDSSVKVDEYGLVDFPPEDDVDQVQVVIRAGSGEQGTPLVSNSDRNTEDIYIEVALGNGTADQGEDLGANTTELMRELIKDLRDDRTRGGKAFDSKGFRWSRWAWGDNTGAGFTIHFQVTYHTNYNDPETQA